ncbi:MAG: hypothetical protein F6K47_21435 [Symploca sp. SIO2E6]|nr:hypothetical protein [Symploca sp. SIO2E6]
MGKRFSRRGDAGDAPDAENGNPTQNFAHLKGDILNPQTINNQQPTTNNK